MAGYVKDKTPVVTYAPTVSGGMGAQALRRFYEHHFLSRLPPSMRLRLLSRTTGADRVVDELYVSFEHTHEVPWMLPGVPPTQRRVEIIMVSIVSLRAGRLYSEHTYWDQASVLVQVGLLDPKLVPSTAHGVDRLPVVGREAARRILNEDPELEQEKYHNRLIRRANAKARRARGSKSVQPEESATEAPSEAERVGKSNTAKQGKVAGRSQPVNPARTAEGVAEEKGHQPVGEEDEGAAPETESTTNFKAKTTDHAAYVEDEGKED